jgi:hypothetical protein
MMATSAPALATQRVRPSLITIGNEMAQAIMA